MYQDHKDLLSAFHAHGVKYLIVGGYAVIFHAQPRFTKDIDLLVKADPANARSIYAAIAEFGAPLQELRPEDFADRSSFFRFGHHLRRRKAVRRSERKTGGPGGDRLFFVGYTALAGV